MNIAAVILIIGHYFDFYLMVMPEPNFPIHHEASADENHLTDTHASTAHVSDGHSVASSHDTKHDSHHESVQTYASLGLPEVFIFLGFIGLFFYTVLSVLSRHRIVPTNNPFLDESLNHQY